MDAKKSVLSFIVQKSQLRPIKDLSMAIFGELIVIGGQINLHCPGLYLIHCNHHK